MRLTTGLLAVLIVTAATGSAMPQSQEKPRPSSSSQGVASSVISRDLDRKTVIDRLGPPTATGDGIHVDKGALVYDLEEFGRLYVYLTGDNVTFWFPADYPLARVKEAKRAVQSQPLRMGGFPAASNAPATPRSADGTSSATLQIATGATTSGPSKSVPVQTQVSAATSGVGGTNRGSAVTPTAARSQGTALPHLGTCGAVPNYRSEVELVRWRGTSEGLTIPVMISIQPRPGLSQRIADLYSQSAFMGLSLWQHALDRRENSPRIRLQTASSPSEALIRIQVVDQIPAGHKPTLLGLAQNTNNGGIISASTISIFRQNGNKTDEAKLAAGGFEAEAVFRLRVARVVAHEIGHALGIQGHPAANGHTMTDHYEGIASDVTTWVSDADVNTLSQAYCVPGAAPARPVAAVNDGNPFTPFAGSWTCSVAPVGVDFFSIRRTGTVSLAGEDKEVRAVVVGNTIRFEQVSFDPIFYDRRLFQFTYADGRLRGTRTETARDRPQVVSQYTCRQQ